MIQSKYSIWFDFILIKRSSICISSRSLLHRHSEVFSLEYVKPGFQLSYEVNGKICNIPYEEGTPFRVNKGELVLRKGIRKRFGFIFEEVSRSMEWPFPSSD